MKVQLRDALDLTRKIISLSNVVLPKPTFSYSIDYQRQNFTLKLSSKAFPPVFANRSFTLTVETPTKSYTFAGEFSIDSNEVVFSAQSDTRSANDVGKLLLQSVQATALTVGGGDVLYQYREPASGFSFAQSYQSLASEYGTKVNVGLIVGCVVGAVVLLAIIGVAVYFIVKAKKRGTKKTAVGAFV